MQGTKINVFDRGLMPGAVGAVLASSSLGLADPYPIGGSVSSGSKTVALHKALQQINGMAIFGLPIPIEAAGNPAQNITGQVRHPRPRNDQKPSVVGDEREVLPPR